MAKLDLRPPTNEPSHLELAWILPTAPTARPQP